MCACVCVCVHVCACACVCVFLLPHPRFTLVLVPFRHAVWEIMFHRQHPNHLFTCSQDSSLWHWNASPSHPHTHTSHTSLATPTSRLHASPDSAPSHTPWLSGAVLRGKVDISNLLPTNKLPVNSLDVESEHVVCGTDSEMLFLVPNLTLR